MTPPRVFANRPGLPELSYRIGTHATFLDAMKARLSSHVLRRIGDELAADGLEAASELRPLAALTTRDPGDPSIALLDAWAVLADVLTFYQERIANEGYLRTATERRSVLELARLVGYSLRPGVAASTYLAYTIDEFTKGEVVISQGAQVQSVPGPGELPQTFQTSDEITARAAWNSLRPRLTQPAYLPSAQAVAGDALHVRGAITLDANDPLLFDYGGEPTRDQVRRVAAAEARFVEGRTAVRLQPVSSGQTTATPTEPVGVTELVPALTKRASPQPANPESLRRSVDGLLNARGDAATRLLAAFQPALQDSLYQAWAAAPATAAASLKNLYRFAVKTGVYGRTAPLRPVLDDRGVVIGRDEWPLAGSIVLELAQMGLDFAVVSAGLEAEHYSRRLDLGGAIEFPLGDESFLLVSYHPDDSRQVYTFKGDGLTVRGIDSHLLTVGRADGDERFYTVQVNDDTLRQIGPGERLRHTTGTYRLAAAVDRETRELRLALELFAVPQPPDVIALDGQFDKIVPNSWVVVERSGARGQLLVALVKSVATRARTDYSLNTTVTELTLSQAWLTKEDRLLSDVRDTVVYAQSEAVPLAEAPVTGDVCGNQIELQGLVDGLQPGRWLIVAGERANIPGVGGVMAAELVMLAGVSQAAGEVILDNGERAPLPGDTVHTVLHLANDGLAHCYKRDTVTIYGNVVKATHGEPRSEVLGSGDGAKAFQTFGLKSPPLTYVAAATASGAASTLEVRVDGVLWHEAGSLAGLGPTDRAYVVQTDDDGKTTVLFGNGLQGARLPTGIENVRGVYRNGIGKAGNLKAGQLTLLATRPMGVKDVTNPLRGSGGADRESRDLARTNAPLAVMALDRLVSVRDYADFARTFAGIGKASAVRLSDGRREVVHVTIAGVDDIPIDTSSDLYRNLVAAMARLGDPYQPFQVAPRELLLLIVKARVRLRPGYRWASDQRVDGVEARVRTALLDDFGFAKRSLGQDVLLAEVLATIQAVPGVAYADVDLVDGVDEATLTAFLAGGDARTSLPDFLAKLRSEQGLHVTQPRARIPVHLARRRSTPTALAPAQLAVLGSDLASTLILEEIPA